MSAVVFTSADFFHPKESTTDHMLDFSQLLDISRISHNQEISNKKRALEALAGLLAPFSEEHSHMDILDALSARERLGSTGLGHGIALPHGRMQDLEQPLAAIITLNKGIDFEAADEQKVDILFALIMPENANDEHLQTLATLAKLFINEDFRQSLRETHEASAILNLFIHPPSSSN